MIRSIRRRCSLCTRVTLSTICAAQVCTHHCASDNDRRGHYYTAEPRRTPEVLVESIPPALKTDVLGKSVDRRLRLAFLALSAFLVSMCFGFSFAADFFLPSPSEGDPCASPVAFTYNCFNSSSSCCDPHTPPGKIDREKFYGSLGFLGVNIKMGGSIMLEVPPLSWLIGGRFMKSSAHRFLNHFLRGRL